MKKLLLAGTTVLLIATSTAQAKVWIRGSPEWYARYNCAWHFQQTQIRAGDPRWRRMAAMRRAGINVRYAVLYTKDGQSITQSADRYCAARGQ